VIVVSKICIPKENVTMNSKRLFQIFVMLALLLSSVGSAQAAQSNSETALVPLEPIVIPRDLSYWNATYIGFVSDSIYEKWQFVFNESHHFVITVTPITGDLSPLLILLDGGGSELARGTGSLTSTQSAGNYSIQVQPQSGSGFYILTLREVVQVQASASTTVNPTTVNVGETATVTVSLNNVPAEGYTSAEFTCTYNAILIEVSNIAVTNLFGADAAVAINGPHPQGGSFIVAIAGSNGNEATTSGTAFTFNATGLQAGQAAIECTVRVSKGDNVLTSLSSTGTTLTVVGSAATATSTPTPFDTPTSETPVGSPTPTSSPPVDTATPTSETPVGSVTPTSETPVGTITATLETPVETATPTSETPINTPTSETPVGSPTATATALPDGTLTGQVLAAKPVTVGLYNGATLVTSVTANNDGTFSLTAPAGTYTVIATASGFLSAQGSATLTAGSSSTKPTVTLLAGDIDGNNVIDQFDALTIGMNYNSATPSAADLNNDNVINVLDLELLAGSYRETGPLVWEVSYP
jgi:hypothetical protein